MTNLDYSLQEGWEFPTKNNSTEDGIDKQMVCSNFHGPRNALE